MTTSDLVVTDGLANVLSGMGTERDKAAATYYAQPTIDQEQLVNAYRGSWMARKIVDIPALDSCRNWRAWQAKDTQIEAIEKEEKRLNLRAKVMDARKKARLFGGAAIYADFGDTASLPLDPARVAKGGVRFLTIFTPRQLIPGDIDTDPMSEFFGTPKDYTIVGGTTGQVTIHPSRLTIFYGNDLPDRDIASGSAFGWADSVLVSVMAAVQRAESAAANINSLIYEANVDVVSIEGLTEILKSNGGEDKVRDLLKMNLAAKSNLRALVLDAKNTYDRKAVSFTTLPDLMDRFDQHAAGAADIPMTRFLGMSPGGMNSTGESDLRNYYDRISSGQELEMGPAMGRLDECLIRSATGDRDAAIHYVWNGAVLSMASGVSIGFRFDPGNQRAASIIRAQAARLITGLVEEQRQQARTIIADGMARGAGPRQVALDLVGRVSRVTGMRDGGVIGLSARLAEYLASARAELAGSNAAGLRNYLERKQRVKYPFDLAVKKALKEGRPLDPALAEKALNGYANSLLRYRGQVIGRTEGIPAVRAAKREAYQQLVDDRRVAAADIERTWHTVRDGRERATHGAMNGQKVEGLDLPFVSPAGASLRYPGDTSFGAPASEIVSCRCDESIRIRPRI